jgi:hypothetical protein
LSASTANPASIQSSVDSRPPPRRGVMLGSIREIGTVVDTGENYA